MRRRVMLAVVSSALAGGTAGCLSFFDEQDVYLGRIAVTNQTQQSQVAHIEVYDNEESVFSTTEELDAYKVGGGVVPGTTTDCGWPSKPGQYHIEVQLRDHKSTASALVGDDDAIRSSDQEQEAEQEIDCYAAVADLTPNNGIRLWFERCNSLSERLEDDLCTPDDDYNGD
ncbi:MAG: hypothetical protein ACQETB_04750 [Halobacteriota archaeon]